MNTKILLNQKITLAPMANIKRVSKLDYVVFVMDFPDFWDPTKSFKNEIRENLAVVCTCEDEDDCICNDRLVCFKERNAIEWFADAISIAKIFKFLGDNYESYLILQCSSVLEASALAKILMEDPHEFCESSDLAGLEFIEIEDKKVLLMNYLHD